MTADIAAAGIPSAPLVSIVVANYNGAPYIAEAVAAARQQSLRDLEIIVSDDASTDDSVGIIRGLMVQDRRIKLICSERNTGPGAARNRALAQARGTWIAVLDGDDLMHPERLRRLIDNAVSDDADIVADDIVAFDTNPARPMRRLLTGSWAKGPSWVDTAQYVRLNGFYGRGPALGYLKPIFRASSFDRRLLRYDETLRIGEDYDLMVRLLRAGARFRIYPLALYHYRRHPASTSHRLDESALLALREADRRFCATSPGADRRLASALAKRSRSLDTAIAYERLLAALKGGGWRQAAAVAFMRPAAVALLRLPIGVRLRRLTSRLASCASTISPARLTAAKADR